MARNIQSLERAAAMLRLLAGGERRLGLSDIASSLGLAKGTAHGILRTLQHEGFVEQDEASGRYQLGAELLRLGTTYLDVHELRARALVWTDDLARSSGESVHLGVLHQQGVLIVHHVFRPDDSRQVLEIGAMQPLHSTALGKVLSAYDPVAHSEALEADRKPFTDRTVCELESFESILDVTRAWVRGGRRGDLGGHLVGRRPHPRPAAHAGRRGRHHRRRGTAVPGRGAAPRADRGRTRLRPRGVAGPGRRTVLRVVHERARRGRDGKDVPALCHAQTQGANPPIHTQGARAGAVRIRTQDRLPTALNNDRVSGNRALDVHVTPQQDSRPSVGIVEHLPAIRARV